MLSEDRKVSCYPYGKVETGPQVGQRDEAECPAPCFLLLSEQPAFSLVLNSGLPGNILFVENVS